MPQTIDVTYPTAGAHVPPVLVATGTVSPPASVQITITATAPGTVVKTQRVTSDDQGNWTATFGLDPGQFPAGAIFKAEYIPNISQSFAIDVGQ